MAEIILGSLALSLAAALVWVYRRQQNAISRQHDALAVLTTAHKALGEEEHRMFVFLHGLGEALAKDETASRMYELIVNGLVDVMGAEGGALYLHDRPRDELVPTHLTRGCPPLIPLPDDVVSAAETNPHSVGSYLRLATVQPGEGPLGRCFVSGEPIRYPNLSKADNLEGFDSPLHRGLAVAAAPLVHTGARLGVLGVLAVARQHPAQPFTDHEFALFNSVAEQSAFALGNAIIHQQAADKKRIDDELKAASEIQRILLPAASPQLSDYNLTGANYPAKIVSGDYYDFVPVDDDHYGVVIADVSGKGIPASLIMAMCRSVLRAHAPGNHSPAAVLSAVNRLIFHDIREDMFISMVYLILHKSSRDITLARAGHDPPFLFDHTHDRIEPINPPGLALGIDAGDVFDRVTKNHTFTMAPGDALLLYTDGTNEALDAAGNEFGLERLKDAFVASATFGSEAIVSAIMTSIREFVGDFRQSDDITLIAIEKR